MTNHNIISIVRLFEEVRCNESLRFVKRRLNRLHLYVVGEDEGSNRRLHDTVGG